MQKGLFFGFIILIILITAGIGSFQKKESKEETEKTPCFLVKDYRIVGHSMEPLLMDGAYVEGMADYYDCKEVGRGEIAILEFKTRQEEFVKNIAAIPGDRLFFENNQLIVNGEIQKNSTGETYSFSETSQRIISAALKNDTIPEGKYLILGEESGANAYDSRQFGLIEKEHLKGRIIQENLNE